MIRSMIHRTFSCVVVALVFLCVALLFKDAHAFKHHNEGNLGASMMEKSESKKPVGACMVSGSLRSPGDRQ